MTNSLKSYEKFFEKLEDSNFENETTRSEKEYEWTREVENKEKMRNVKGLSSIVDKFRIVR
tara:strand:- start:23 stop:205 length:183 start_codon:yes stop_codon:yes gene_type:complete